MDFDSIWRNPDMNVANRRSGELTVFYEATHDYDDISDESFYLDAASTRTDSTFHL